MNILRDDKMILRTGSSRIVHADQWSVMVESIGLAPNGDPVAFRVAFSHGEIAMIARKSREAAKA